MSLVMTRRRFLESAACATAAAAWPWPAWAVADEYVTLDATAQAALVRSGRVSSLELVDAAIARIEALNPKINAFVSTNFERARE